MNEGVKIPISASIEIWNDHIVYNSVIEDGYFFWPLAKGTYTVLVKTEYGTLIKEVKVSEETKNQETNFEI